MRCTGVFSYALRRVSGVERHHFLAVSPLRRQSQMSSNRGGTFPIKKDALKNELHAVCTTIYRSSSARGMLCESIHEPSPENALLLLEKFEREEGVWRRRDWVERFEKAYIENDTSAKLQAVVERFRQWYYAKEAPQRINMTAPQQWYPLARYTRRRFVLHCGPTNSGKTHTALERLIGARSGVYCAPLKALAGQVWQTVNDAGTPCDLLIGDERKFAGGAEHVSCTIEMTPVDTQVDVAVIDEIQMIGDTERGWAWTRAVLGIPAREVHLCGEARAIPLVKKLLYSTFELKYLEIVEHERLVPLKVSPCLNNDLQSVENGDCFIAFSYRNVIKYRNMLRGKLGSNRVKVAFLYGGMPFHVRRFQMNQYNQGVQDHVLGNTSCKHILVATDAVAYGLNMNVERIIFTTVRKFSPSRDGTEPSHPPVPPPLIQQISGRAGRHGLTRRYPHGRCTTLHPRDYPYFCEAMNTELPPLPKAGLLPTADVLVVHLELCAIRKLKEEGTVRTPTIMEAEKLWIDGKMCYEWISQFFELQTKHFNTDTTKRHQGKESLYFLCDASRSVLRVLEALRDNDALLVPHRILFSYLPLNDSSPEAIELLKQYAEDHSHRRPVTLRIDAAFQHYMSSTKEGTRDIRAIERLFKRAEMYNWLSWRFRETFVYRDEAEALKAKCVAEMVNMSK